MGDAKLKNLKNFLYLKNLEENMNKECREFKLKLEAFWKKMNW